jgi:hypothetical protein
LSLCTANFAGKWTDRRVGTKRFKLLVQATNQNFAPGIKRLAFAKVQYQMQESSVWQIDVCRRLICLKQPLSRSA